MFLEFRQNNSGGSFVFNNDLSAQVIIEGNSYNEIIDKAIELGIYFDGCEKGMDCDCCGDRWYQPDKSELKQEIELEKMYDNYRWGTTHDLIIHYLDHKEYYTIKDRKYCKIDGATSQ